LEAYLIFKEQTIPYETHIKYFGVISDKKITWKMHIEMTEANAFSIGVHSIGQRKATQRKYKRLKLGISQAYGY
jgi:hypothetical protein